MSEELRLKLMFKVAPSFILVGRVFLRMDDFG